MPLPTGPLSRNRTEGQTLAVRLSAGLSPTNPLRLVITARRTTAKLRTADLAPIRFRHATDIKRLVAVRPVSPCSLILTGDESLKRLHAEKLAPAEQELFAELPQDLLFDSDPRAERLEVALVGQKPKYNGAIQIDAAVGEGKAPRNVRLSMRSPIGARGTRAGAILSAAGGSAPVDPRRRRRADACAKMVRRTNRPPPVATPRSKRGS